MTHHIRPIALALGALVGCNGQLLDGPPVDITLLEPMEDGVILLQQVAPDTIGGDPRWRISLQMRILNDGPDALALREVYINGELASDFLTGGLQIAAGDAQTFQNCRCGKVEGDPDRSDAHGSRIVIADAFPPVVEVELYFAGFEAPVTTFWGTGEHVNDGGPLRWPGHAADLGENEVWRATSHHGSTHQVFALDTDVRGWNPLSGAWDRLYPGGDPLTPEDHRAYGKPVYAMSDGEVCWAVDDHPEWADIAEYGLKKDGSLAAADWPESPIYGGYLPGGNQIFVKSGDEVWVAAHLQPGSIPSELLVPGAAVVRGQYLGKVGYSGDTDFPHTHIHVKTEPQGGAGQGNPNTGAYNFCDSGRFRPMSFADMQHIPEAGARDAIEDTGDIDAGHWFEMTNHSAQHPTSANNLGLMYPTLAAFFFRQDPVDQRQYIGVFDRRDTIDLRVRAESWDDFTHRWDALAGDRFELTEVETLFENGTRVFLGTFERGTTPTALIGLTGFAAFAEAYGEQVQLGRRLVDLDAYFDGTAVHYIGVFKPGQGAEALLGHSDEADFFRDWAVQGRLGMRLVDIDIVTVGGAQRYVSVYRSGDDGHSLARHRGWDAFIEHWNVSSEAGLRLTDLETYLEADGTRAYISAFRAGAQGYALISSTGWSGFLRHVERLSVQGLKLVDVVVEQ